MESFNTAVEVQKEHDELGGELDAWPGLQIFANTAPESHIKSATTNPWATESSSMTAENLPAIPGSLTAKSSP